MKVHLSCEREMHPLTVLLALAARNLHNATISVHCRDNISRTECTRLHVRGRCALDGERGHQCSKSCGYCQVPPFSHALCNDKWDPRPDDRYAADRLHAADPIIEYDARLDNGTYAAQFGAIRLRAPLTPLSGLRYLAYALARSPILVGRTGKVETDALIAIDGRHPPQASLATNAGVFAATADLDAATWRTFYDEYLASVRATDYMQLPTAVCGSQAEFIEYFGLDFALFKYYGTHLDTWLEMLVAFARQGTRLLVVSPFVDSIATNLPKISLIHPKWNLTGLRVHSMLRTPQTFGWAKNELQNRTSWLLSLKR